MRIYLNALYMNSNPKKIRMRLRIPIIALRRDSFNLLPL
jgi:hypothetical protein